jgi:hypothetical protein
MKTKGKLSVNLEEDLWKSLIEQDVMQLRIRLNDIHIAFENEIRNYNMNSNEDSVNFM